MSHIRDAMPHGSKHCACPRQLQGSFLTEQLPQELQCQFVLKPSRLAESPPLHGTWSPAASGTQSLPMAWQCWRKPVCWDGGWAVRSSGQMFVPAAQGFCCVVLPDLSTLLPMCCFYKLQFDKLPARSCSKTSKRKTRSSPCRFCKSVKGASPCSPFCALQQSREVV